jgi:hypothetical protein
VHVVSGVSIKLIQRIREEFEEAPWRRFTVDEAAQFWGLDVAVCGQVMGGLVAAGFLAGGLDNRFGVRLARLDGGWQECGWARQVHA